MKCRRCAREIGEEQTYAYQGKAFCEDCLMEIGLHAGRCEPWASYLATRARAGQRGTEGLTTTQKKVYQFIKSQGRTTREEAIQSLGLSEAELDAQLTPLMHSELVKERGEGSNIYLVPIG